jgi:EAL domain-containing protein (putative c-di-GMP-specific phosphodiesterase class I)
MTFKIDIHIGAVAVMGNALSSQAMLLKAENALQKAKLQQLPFFVDSSAENHEEPYNWRMEKDLLDALEQNRLELYYQPKISLKTGKPEHAEALLRWHSPEHGQIPPDQIIPILERAGKMMLLSKWLINTALRQANDWPREQGIIGVAINIPANIIHDRTLRDIVEDAIKIWGIKPELLTLEITESAVIQDQQSSYNNLSHLKQAGIKISIDDFGTGYSSLEYFKSIPADELKIDKSFVLNVLKKVADKNIVQLIIDLAHKFDLNVVAEGIEEKETLELLRTLDCDFAQGYHIARPMSQTKFIAWLNEFSTQN